MASNPVVRFSLRSVRYKIGKFIIPDAVNTDFAQLHPKLPFPIRDKKYRIKNPIDNTRAGQLDGLAYTLTALFRDERVEANYNRGTEVRGYAERLIVEAMRFGDRHRPTMELADFWLKEKQLIHKLFKVLVPRYLDYKSPFTAVHRLGIPYEWAKERPGPKYASRWWTQGRVILELNGNHLPPIHKPHIDRSSTLSNVLIQAAREKTTNM